MFILTTRKKIEGYKDLLVLTNPTTTPYSIQKMSVSSDVNTYITVGLAAIKNLPDQKEDIEIYVYSSDGRTQGLKPLDLHNFMAVFEQVKCSSVRAFDDERVFSQEDQFVLEPGMALILKVKSLDPTSFCSVTINFDEIKEVEPLIT